MEFFYGVKGYNIEDTRTKGVNILEEKQKKDLKEAQVMEEKIGLALNPLIRFGVNEGMLAEGLHNPFTVDMLWNMSDTVAETFRDERITQLLVFTYIQEAVNHFTFQTGELSSVSAITMLKLLEVQRITTIGLDHLARRF